MIIIIIIIKLRTLVSTRSRRYEGKKKKKKKKKKQEGHDGPVWLTRVTAESKAIELGSNRARTRKTS